MAVHAVVKYRNAGKAILKVIKILLYNLDRFFRGVQLIKGSSKTKAVSFKAALIQTRGFKFDREEANA